MPGQKSAPIYLYWLAKAFSLEAGKKTKKEIKLCMVLILIRMPGESLQVPLFPWSILQHWYCLNIKTGMCSDCKKK